ncbi:MAG TPA: GGDEF domain-containing protein, partial [Spirochaetales bacterium]|nr:GGDEF domain-containing protein [Spirochaetales bacterium]
LIVAAAGAVSLVYGHGALSPSVMNAFVVDFVLMALLSALIWLRTCRSRRREYSKSLELDYISKTDQLTGLGNRRYLAERYAEAKARMMRYGEGSAIIMADLDYFKALNDNYGHEEGDKVLKEASRRFSESLRSEDSLCRWGGEEFVALISYATLDAALESAKRLQSALRSTPMEVVGTVRASFGVTMVGTDETLDDTVARADRALYRAKNAGRDRVELEP